MLAAGGSNLVVPGALWVEGMFQLKFSTTDSVLRLVSSAVMKRFSHAVALGHGALLVVLSYRPSSP